MKIKNSLIVLLLCCATSATAGYWPFHSESDAITSVLEDKTLEFDTFKKLFSDEQVRRGADITVLTMGDTVLVAGVAENLALRDRIEKIVLKVVRVERVTGDNVRARPANDQLCEKKKQHLFNDRRKFNLQNNEQCSRVDRVFNRVVISEPGNSLSKAEGAILTARVELALAKQNALENEGVPVLKITSIGGTVFVLAHKEIGNEQQVVKWIESVSGTEKIEFVR